jgi:hypothetical protein
MDRLREKVPCTRLTWVACRPQADAKLGLLSWWVSHTENNLPWLPKGTQQINYSKWKSRRLEWWGSMYGKPGLCLHQVWGPGFQAGEGWELSLVSFLGNSLPYLDSSACSKDNQETLFDLPPILSSLYYVNWRIKLRLSNGCNIVRL